MDDSRALSEKIAMMTQKIGTWPREPMRLEEGHIEDLLLWCVNQGASDTTLQTDRPVYIEVDGILYPITRRYLDSADMANALGKIYGADALAKLASGQDLDLSFEVRPNRETRKRFRVNITAILSRARDSVQITLRTLPDLPPTMLELGIEQGIMDNWNPRQGLILVTGPTGSGKTTLLAAGMRMLIESEMGCGKMLTYEAPIEYVYDAVVGPRSLVAQSEIPRHLQSFAAGVRNALRRKPNIILVGEARDRETVSAAIEAGQTGHLVFSTVHTIGVAATIRRMVSVFDPGERTERAYAMMETMRMIVTQALVPRVGGGRVGLREYLVFDENVRETLLDLPTEKWTGATRELLLKHGQPMELTANKAFKEGIIDNRSRLLLTKGFMADEREDESKGLNKDENEAAAEAAVVAAEEIV
jgi:defect-in-organelle-trafficking protein DotB